MFIVQFTRDHMGNTAGSEAGIESRDVVDRLARDNIARLVREEVRKVPVVCETPEITALAQRWRAANGFEPIVATVEPSPRAAPLSVPPASPASPRRKG